MRTRSAVAVVGAALALFMALPGVAWAEETDTSGPPDRVTDETGTTDTITDRHPHPCRALKGRALEAIERRLAAIDRMQEAVASNAHLTESHQAQLEADLASAERGLGKLAEEIEEAACDELPDLVRRIVDDYRVFPLLVPKVHLVVAADTIMDVVQRLEGLAERLQEVIDRFESEGYDVLAAQAELDEMQAQLEAAFRMAEPVPGTVLHLKSSDWPEAQSVLEEAFRSVRGSAAEVRAAGMSAHQVVKALREAKNA